MGVRSALKLCAGTSDSRMKRGLGLDAGQNNHLHFFKVHAGDELAERFAQVGFEVFRVRSDRLVLAQKLVDIQDGILY